MPGDPGDPGDGSRTLSSYPKRWQEIICYAKRMFRAYIAGTNGFPDAVTGVREAREYLEESLAIHIEGGGTVETGMSKRHVPTCRPPDDHTQVTRLTGI